MRLVAMTSSELLGRPRKRAEGWLSSILLFLVLLGPSACGEDEDGATLDGAGQGGESASAGGRSDHVGGQMGESGSPESEPSTAGSSRDDGGQDNDEGASGGTLASGSGDAGDGAASGGHSGSAFATGGSDVETTGGRAAGGAAAAGGEGGVGIDAGGGPGGDDGSGGMGQSHTGGRPQEGAGSGGQSQGGAGSGGHAEASGGSGETAGGSAGGGAVVDPGTGGTDSGGASTGTGGVAGDAVGGSGGAGSGGGPGGGSGGTGTSGTGGETGGGPGQDCPDSSAHVGDPSWQLELEVTEAGTAFCGAYSTARTLEQDYAAKAKLMIPAGTYSLPQWSGTFSFALPVCFEWGPGLPGPAFVPSGTDDAEKSTHYGTDMYSHYFGQPLDSSDAIPWGFYGWVEYMSNEGVIPDPVVVDGTGSAGYNFALCRTEACLEIDDVVFDACNPTAYALEKDRLVFDGGEVTFSTRIGPNRIPGTFVGAEGTLDGDDFEETEYWQLIYAPEHHHFVKSFAVLFDAPIHGSCGLKAENIGEPDLVSLSTIECDLSSIEERTISDVSAE